MSICVVHDSLLYLDKDIPSVGTSYWSKMSTEEEPELKPIATDGGPFKMDVYQPAGYVLPRSYRSCHKRVLDLPIRDDDVWLVSHPKCGSTWTSEMVWLLRNNLNFQTAKQVLLTERIPFFEHSSLFLNNLNEEQQAAQKKKLPKIYGDSIDFVDQWPESNGPRTIKTHLHWNVLPRNLRRPDSKAKIIYIAREAKDVCVSFYHHHRLIHNYQGSFDEYAEHFINDRLMFAPFWNHLLEFWNQRDRENILFLKYEDMKKDLTSVIQQVNEFLNLAPLTDEQMKNLNDHLSFESMKNNKAVNVAGSFLKEKLKVADFGDGRFIRKGIVGDWKGTMSQDLVNRFDNLSKEKTTGSGLTF